MTWVYLNRCVANVAQGYEVGCWAPDGSWQPDSIRRTREEAAARAHWLNGGDDEQDPSLSNFDDAVEVIADFEMTHERPMDPTEDQDGPVARTRDALIASARRHRATAERHAAPEEEGEEEN